MFNGAANAWFNGEIADVQAYSAALTSAQVTTLYAGGAAVGSGAALAGPVEVRAIFAGASGPTTTDKVEFTFDPANASAAESQIGPGSVNLLTGNFSITASDSSVTRFFNTRQPGAFDSTHMFGPGWNSSVSVSGGETPFTALLAAGSLVQVTMAGGSSIGFTATSSSSFLPEIGAEGLTLSFSATSNSYTLSESGGISVIFTHVPNATVGLYAPSVINEPNQSTNLTWESATVDGVVVTRPTQLLAPVPAGVTCTMPLTTNGCRTLTFTYATTTTATGTSQAGWGDYIGRARKISFTAWDPATETMKTIDVSCYLYDSNGRLVAQWDPRLDNGATHLWTTYAYNLDGTLAALAPRSEPAWSFGYTTIPGDSGVGRLASVSRSALDAGTATTTVVYRVPTSGAGAPYDMSVGQTTRWDQEAAPAQATAVFDPEQVPGGDQAAGTMPMSWTRAVSRTIGRDAGAASTVRTV